MGDLLIRGMPEALKLDIERAARLDGDSLSAKAIDLLRRGIAAEKEASSETGISGWEALRSAFLAEGPLDDEYWNIMQEIEAERKLDFGRPVDFPDDELE